MKSVARQDLGSDKFSKSFHTCCEYSFNMGMFQHGDDAPPIEGGRLDGSRRCRTFILCSRLPYSLSVSGIPSKELTPQGKLKAFYRGRWRRRRATLVRMRCTIPRMNSILLLVASPPNKPHAVAAEVDVVALPRDGVDLLGEDGVQHAPQQDVEVAEQEEEHGHLVRGFVCAHNHKEPLRQTRTPHEDACAEGQPLMMRDNLVRRVADGRLDEDVEAARDEDGRDEAQQEEEDHVVSHELSSTYLTLF